MILFYQLVIRRTFAPSKDKNSSLNWMKCNFATITCFLNFFFILLN